VVREWDNIETSESSKAPSQPIGWNPGGGQRKMITESSKILISEEIETRLRKGTALKTREC
jgi:hypothetical protein